MLIDWTLINRQRIPYWYLDPSDHSREQPKLSVSRMARQPARHGAYIDGFRVSQSTWPPRGYALTISTCESPDSACRTEKHCSCYPCHAYCSTMLTFTFLLLGQHRLHHRRQHPHDPIHPASPDPLLRTAHHDLLRRHDTNLHQRPQSQRCRCIHQVRKPRRMVQHRVCRPCRSTLCHIYDGRNGLCSTSFRRSQRCGEK